MKLDSDIKGLLKGVFTGCVILCAAEAVLGIAACAAGLFGLQADAVSVSGVVLGSAGGTAVAMLVFWWMCVSLQKSLDRAALGGMDVKRGVQAGYTKRLLVQGIWVVIAALVPFINTVCGLIPLLFPKFAIYLLQITGKLALTQKTRISPAPETAQEAEGTLTSGTKKVPAPGAKEAPAAEAAGMEEKTEAESGDKGGEN